MVRIKNRNHVIFLISLGLSRLRDAFREEGLLNASYVLWSKIFKIENKGRNEELSSREYGCFPLILHYTQTGSLVSKNGTAVCICVQD